MNKFQNIVLDVLDRIDNEEFSGYVALNDPASESALDMLQGALGQVPIPVELREWLTTHDGEHGTSGLFGTAWQLYSASEIASYYLSDQNFGRQYAHLTAEELSPMLYSLRGPVKPKVTSKHRIPFLSHPYGHGYLDMDPSYEGNLGQILFVNKVDGIYAVVFRSMTEMFSRFRVDPSWASEFFHI